MRNPIAISIEKSIVDSIDRRRGMIPRSRFIEKIVKDTLEVSA